VEQRTGQKVQEHLVDQGSVDLESLARAHQAGVAGSATINVETKCRFGVRTFAVRGLRKVRCVVLWLALAYNLLHFAQELLKCAAV
jgi:hypothetical protein